MAKANGKKAKAAKPPQGITHITVGGYKSIAREQTIEIRPLTVLAGANSSGKSSIMQPLLLLKQTLEAPYDPGALLLNGPNVKFTSIDQMLARNSPFDASGAILIGLEQAPSRSIRVLYSRNSKKQIDIEHMRFKDTSSSPVKELSASMGRDEMIALMSENFSSNDFEFSVVRNRCFLSLLARKDRQGGSLSSQLTPAGSLVTLIRDVIHLPGLRGNPERSYALSSIGPSFPGTFEVYTASTVSRWTTEDSEELLDQLGEDLKCLGLTWRVRAKPINDTQVELKVARLTKPSRGGAHDLVNIADVGFGVSQTLPVVVALLVAKPGQLVYLEQPELHLHPAHQVAMALLLANATNRGVKVVVETHSSLLLLGIESLVAEGKLSQANVILHWFERDNEGATNIRTGELDYAGRSGEWPEDFDDVSLEAQRRYLDAVDRRVAHE